MRALVVGDGAAVADRPPPENAGECRIQVGLAGICGTDLEILKGYAGFQGIPGHEFVGVVESAPDGDRHWIGKRVVGEINAACGACDWCRQGLKTHCPTRSVLGIVDRGGAFASMLSLPADNLHEGAGVALGRDGGLRGADGGCVRDPDAGRDRGVGHGGRRRRRTARTPDSGRCSRRPAPRSP